MTNQQTPARASEYPPLPEPDASTVGLGAVWNRHSMRAYADAARAMQTQTTPAGKYLPLPVRFAYDDEGNELFSAAQMFNYVDADRAMRESARLAETPACEGASYESMNLAVMVLSDCGHSSNYKPLLERVAGRIDRHVERLLTAQHADRAQLAQAAPASVAGPSQWACKTCGCEYGVAGEPYWTHDRTPHPVEAIWRCDKCDATHEIKLVEPTQAAPAAQGDVLAAPAAVARQPLTRQQVIDRFGFLEGIVNEANFLRIVDEACALAPTTQPAPAAQGDALDAARYRCIRRGQHWSVIDGIGNELRAEALDTAIDAARKQGANHD